MSKFSVKQTRAGFSFNLVADNNEIVATSQVYTSKAACRKGINSVQTNAPLAPVEDQTAKGFKAEVNPKFEIFADRAGKFRFRLRASNGEIIAASQGYKAKASCQKGIDSVRVNAIVADIVDEGFVDKKVTDGKAAADSQHAANQRITDGNYDRSLAVKCVNGTFVGRRTENIIAYRGIPFVASQPVGELRWKAPVAPVADDGVYEAYYNAKNPCQHEELSDYQGEDCLYLNIWKADEADEAKKPVMVWIHGGAFVAGGTGLDLFDFHNYVKENPDVIVVTVAYRLGAFGYIHLSHLPDGQDYPDAQNLGPMDQLMALRWVRENIAGFGGDPDNVTIWGESAGAGSVTLLPLLPGAQAYFKRVIAQSGTPTLTRSPEEAIGCTDELMEILGCKTVADLKKVDARKLVEASAGLSLRTCPERDGSLIPLDPHEAYASGAAKDIQFLQGCDRDEFKFFVSVMGEEEFKVWAANRKAVKLARLTDEERARVESFCSDVKGDDCERDARLFDQLWFNTPMIRMSENQTKGGGQSYSFYFTAEPGHGEELPIVFNQPVAEGEGRVFDETFSKTIRRMWIQFAKTGNPSLSADISPDGKAKEWPLYDPENRQLMVLDEFDIHPEKESERKIVDWDRTYFLTKYYLF